MKRTITVLAAVVMLGRLAAAEEPQDLSRYQVIIKRSPFGAVLDGQTALAPKFADRFQLVGLVRAESGRGSLQAIIHDREANRSYFRAAGEKIGADVTVVEIGQLPTGKIVLRSGLETGTLIYQERSTAPVAPVVSGQSKPVLSSGRPPVRIPFRQGNVTPKQ